MPGDPAALLRQRLGEVAFDPPADPPLALLAVLDRRVTRRYRSDPVPDALLGTLLAAAQSAPSKSDLQQYSIVVLRDPSRIAAIADWIGTMPWIKDAPVFLVFCGDMRRGQRLCELHGREHANNNLDTFLNTAVDAALAMGAMMAAADAAGLGTCPISYVRNHVEKLAPLLGLPRGVFPVAGLTLGWPEARNELSPRLPPRLVVHHERYDDAALPEAVPDYDARHRRARARYPEIHGPAPEGCTWSENAARQLSVPERFGLATWLRTRGFDLA
jgi:nitroreductase/FMN reductase [NAD(P)H]